MVSQLLLLTCGRWESLQAALRSVQRQGIRCGRLVLASDAGPVPETLRELAGPCGERLVLAETPRPRSGQWANTAAGLAALDPREPFCLMHDDDELGPGYLEHAASVCRDLPGEWAEANNWMVFDEKGDRGPVFPELVTTLRLNNRAEVLRRYATSFVPFPGTLFRCPAAKVREALRPEFMEMADAVLFCELARTVPIRIEARSLYRYRRHAGQVSHAMDHPMEDKLQAYLLKESTGSAYVAEIRRELEKRRAGRYFQEVWRTGTFRGHSFRKDFPWIRIFRAVRNRKWLALKILVSDLCRAAARPQGAS